MKQAGGDLLALTMVLEGRKVAKVARNEVYVVGKDVEKANRSDKIHGWLDKNGLSSLFVVHVDEKMCNAYINKTGLYRYLGWDDHADKFEQLTTALSEIAFFLAVSPSFRSEMGRKMWHHDDRLAALYALYKTPYRPSSAGSVVRELVVVSNEHKKQCPSIVTIAMLANIDSEETRFHALYWQEHGAALAMLPMWGPAAPHQIIRAHVREQLAAFQDPNLEKAPDSISSSSGGSSSSSSSSLSRTSRTSFKAAAAAAAAAATASARAKK